MESSGKLQDLTVLEQEPYMLGTSTGEKEFQRDQLKGQVMEASFSNTSDFTQQSVLLRVSLPPFSREFKIL